MYPNLNAPALGVQATLPETIDYAARYGFRGIDFSITEAQSLVQQHDIDYVRNLFAAKDILPGAFGFPVEFRKDEATWRDSLNALPAQAELAARLGCLRTFTWLMPAHDERDFYDNFGFHVTRLRPAAEILAEHNIRLGLEFIGPRTLRAPRQYRFIYTMEGMLGLAAAIGTGNVGLLLDIWHLYTSKGSVDQVHELRNQDVVVVHINDAPAGIRVEDQIDNQRALPGETGVLDMDGFLRALKAINYDGPVTAEPFSQRVRDMEADDAISLTAQSVHGVWQHARIGRWS